MSPDQRGHGSTANHNGTLLEPLPTHLSPIIAEDPHHADRNSFVQTAPQSFAVESKHEGNVLLAGVIDNGMQGVIQPTCPRTRETTGKHVTWGMVWTLVAKVFFSIGSNIPKLPSLLQLVACARCHLKKAGDAVQAHCSSQSHGRNHSPKQTLP